MGIFQRFGEIMEANVNAFLDKCEDPEKMIDQTLRDLNESLAEVKKETAGVMGEETGARRRVEDLEKRAAKLKTDAQAALVRNDEGTARRILADLTDVESQLASAKDTLNIAQQRSAQMKSMYNKLTADINALNGKRQDIKAKAAMAKTQNKLNDLADRVGNSNVGDKFSRMEARIQKEFDQAMAGAELSGYAVEMEAREHSVEVDSRLAQMKAELGIQ